MQILVVGMHRSGTSAVTRLLNLMGAYFGPEGVAVEANPGNPRGHWERRDVLQLHDDLLRAADAEWFKLAEFELDKVPEAAQQQFRLQAGQILQGLDAHRPWVLKDPRLCLTLPLWRPLLEAPLVVYTQRSPLQIAQSLQSRSLIPLYVGVALWEKYTVAALRGMTDLPVVKVFHPDLMGDPLACVQSLWQQLQDHQVRGLRQVSEREVTAFIDPAYFRARGDADQERRYLTEHQRGLLEFCRDFSHLETADTESLQVSEQTHEILAGFEEARHNRHGLREAQVKLRTGEADLAQARHAALLREQQWQQEQQQERQQERQRFQQQAEQQRLALHAEQQQQRQQQQQWQQRQQQLQQAQQRQQEHISRLEGELARARTEARQGADRLAGQEKLAQQRHQEVMRLNRWLSQVDYEMGAFLDSWRWKLGHNGVRLAEWLLRRGRPFLATDHIQEILHNYRAWSGSLASVSDTPRQTALGLPLPPPRQSAAARTTRPYALDAAPPPWRDDGFAVYPLSLPAPAEDAPRPGVSAIILNRDGAALLRDLFASVERHLDYRPLEFLVVDHASEDDSLAVLQEFAARLPIRVLKMRQNYSFAYSNNYAAREAQYDYLLFLNNDIVFNSDGLLERLLAPLLADPGVGLSGARLLYPQAVEGRRAQHSGIKFYPDPRHGFYRPYNLRHSYPEDSGEVLQLPAVTAALALCRKSEFLDLGGFDETYVYGYEDVDLCLNYYRRLAKRSVLVNRAEALHNESVSQHRDNKDAVRQRRLNNIAHFSQRHGYGLKRAVWQELLGRRRYWSEAPCTVAFVVTEAHPDTTAGDYFTALELAEALSAEFAWEVRFLARRGGDQDSYDLSGVDVLVVMVDAYDLRQIHSARPQLLKLAWMRNWFERWAERPWFERYDVFLASSQKAVDFLRQQHAKPAHLLRIATNPQRFSPAPAAAKPEYDYCFTGSYWNAKRDIETLDPSHLPYRFALFGHGWDKHAQFKPYWKGFLPYAQVPEVYRDSTLLVDDANHVTKHWHSVNSRVFDALASGILVLSNGEGGAQEVFGDALPSYQDPQQLHQLLTYYLEHPQQRQQLAEQLRQLVLAQHTYRHRARELQALLSDYRRDKFRFAIKIAVPKAEEVHEWGDYHFALALSRALVKQGHSVRIDILPDWYNDAGFGDDVVLVLRGLSAYQPQPQHLNLMWNISHPDKLSHEEYEQYHHVFVASNTYAEELGRSLKVPVSPLLQCTDPALFYPDPDPTVPAHPVLFVGNSRKQYREIVRHAIEAKLPLRVYGTRWKTLIPADYLEGEHIPNVQLRKYYSRCEVLLNDHWAFMRNHGFISNRLFDAGACGALIVSDSVQGLEDVFGDSVLTYRDDPASLAEAVRAARQDPTRRERISQQVLAGHTFDHRAAVILEQVAKLDAAKSLPTRQLPPEPEASATPSPLPTPSATAQPPARAVPAALPLPPQNLRFMNEDDEKFRRIGINNLQWLQHFGFTETANLLDVGCGYGRLAYALLEVFPEYRGHYTGLDILPRHIEWCQNTFRAYSNIEFLFRDVYNDRYNPGGTLRVQDLQLADLGRRYDYCALFSVFTHLYEDDIRHYLKQIHAALKPSGVCLATFFLFDAKRMEIISRKTEGFTIPHELNPHTRYNDPENKLHVIAYETAYVQRLVAELGFEIVVCEYGTWAGLPKTHGDPNTGTTAYFQDVLVLRALPGAEVEPCAPSTPAPPARPVLPLPPPNLRFMQEDDAKFKQIGETNLQWLRQLGLGPDSSLLDLGCGYGRLAYALLDAFGQYRGHYTGVDILPRHLAWCRETFSAYPNIEFVFRDIYNDRYNPGGKLQVQDIDLAKLGRRYDYCALFSVFTHLYEQDIRHYLQQIRQVLQPSGMCLATFFLFDAERLRNIRQRASGYTLPYELNAYTRYNDPDNKLHVIAYDTDFIRRLARELGFSVRACHYGNWAPGSNAPTYQDILVLQLDFGEADGRGT